MNSSAEPFRNCPRCGTVLKGWTSGSVCGRCMMEQAERTEAKQRVVANATLGRGERSVASRLRTQKNSVTFRSFPSKAIVQKS